MTDRPATVDNVDAADAIDDAATALEGIAEALALRAAAFPDSMLELLSDAASARAEALRRMAWQ